MSGFVLFLTSHGLRFPVRCIGSIGGSVPGFVPSPRRPRRNRATADSAAVEVLTGHDDDEDEGQEPKQSEQGEEGRVE